MPKVVFDSTILVSAFLTPKGLSDELLRQGRGGAFLLYLSAHILEETRRILLEEELEKKRLRKKFSYTNEDVFEYEYMLRGAAYPALEASLTQAITPDPNDDKVIASALGAGAQYLVTRDKALLNLKQYQGIKMIRPEEFIHLLREQSRKL